jgi:hypothetical protein
MMGLPVLNDDVIKEIRASTESSEVLAERYGLPVQMVEAIRAAQPSDGTGFIVGGI